MGKLHGAWWVSIRSLALLPQNNRNLRKRRRSLSIVVIDVDGFAVLFARYLWQRKAHLINAHISISLSSLSFAGERDRERESSWPWWASSSSSTFHVSHVLPDDITPSMVVLPHAASSKAMTAAAAAPPSAVLVGPLSRPPPKHARSARLRQADPMTPGSSECRRREGGSGGGRGSSGKFGHKAAARWLNRR